MAGQSQKNADCVLECFDGFLGKVLDQGGDFAVLELVDEFLGFIGVAFQRVNDVAGDIGDVADDFIGSEETFDDITIFMI